MEETGQNQAEEIIMEESVKEEEQDRISLLPDGLIIEILSRLPSTKNAIRTGVLSKRWQHLWTVVHTLIFIDNNINTSIYNRYLSADIFSFINKAITQCQSREIKKLLLHISFHVGFESQLNNFIRFAINRNVQELSLLSSYLGDNHKFEFKDDTFFNSSCFTHLKLEHCIFRPSGVISWDKLKSLCVSRVKLDKDLIQNILSGSPLLETLKLKYCCGYRRLDITSKSVKNLVISGYHNWFTTNFGMDIIQINAPNVLSLTIKKALYLRKILLQDVSSLHKACLNYTINKESLHHNEKEEEEMIEGFILKLHHVKELQVGKHHLQVLSRLETKGRLQWGLKYITAANSYSDND
uniref:F-box protein At5g03100-like n=1 Tax=Erigeron canadensis TaxID=72917 RepID=UPI001CB9171A|nr:F-box protein At5g03100-like [Erigeron canadensis]